MTLQAKGKLILVGLTLILISQAALVKGQVTINSPYTRYGLGDLVENGMDPRITAMGGLYYGLQGNNLLNSANPASYAAFDSVSFIFDAGIFGLLTNLKTTKLSDQGSYISLSHLMFGFPITRWWRTSVGVLPFSYVGYDIYNTEQLEGITKVENVYQGSGGLSQLYWGNGFRVGKKLSLGINLKYMFGSITRSRGVTFPDSIEMKNTYIRGSIRPRDFYGEVGFQYKASLPKGMFMVIGGVFGPQVEIKSKASRLVTTYFGNINTAQLYYDTIDVRIDEPGSFTLPVRIGTGITVGKDGKWVAGADFMWQNWEKYRYYGQSDSLLNRWNIAIGGEYIPDARGMDYLKKISYRAGVHFGYTPMYLQGKHIQEVGLSFGVGLPIKKSKSTINMSASFGRTGTTLNGLIQENFFRFTIGVNIFENWFFKSKYF